MNDQGEAFTQVLASIYKKRFETDEIEDEYEELEGVPPAHDRYLQHKTMVQQEMCKIAEKNKFRNRYSNLFPFDENLVQLEVLSM